MPKKRKKQGYEDLNYLKRVRELSCPICGGSTVAHHPTRIPFDYLPKTLIAGGSMGGKVPDVLCFPLCPYHHNQGNKGIAIHEGVDVWEELYGEQYIHVMETQRELGYEGIYEIKLHKSDYMC